MKYLTAFALVVALAIPCLATTGISLTPLGLDTFCDDAGFSFYETIPKGYFVTSGTIVSGVSSINSWSGKWRVNGGTTNSFGGAAYALGGGEWFFGTSTLDTSNMQRYDILEIWFEADVNTPSGQCIFSTFGTRAHYTVEIALGC